MFQAAVPYKAINICIFASYEIELDFFYATKENIDAIVLKLYRSMKSVDAEFCIR